MPPKKITSLKSNKIIGKSVTFEHNDLKDEYSSSSSESGSESSSDSSEDELNTEVYDEVEDDDKLENDNDASGEEDDKSGDEDDNDKQSVTKTEQEDVDDEDCVYRFNKKTDLDSDNETDEEIDDNFFDDDEIIEKDVYVLEEDRITKPVLTKYEKVRLLQERTTQLALGAKPMVKDIPELFNSSKPKNPKEIAKLELQYKVIPLKIIRMLPTGKKEKWSLSELAIVN